MHTSTHQFQIQIHDPIPQSNDDDLLQQDVEEEEEEQSIKRLLLRRAESTHGRLPGIRKIPLPAIGIISLIAVINLVVWAAAGVVLVCFICHLSFSFLRAVTFDTDSDMCSISIRKYTTLYIPSHPFAALMPCLLGVGETTASMKRITLMTRLRRSPLILVLTDPWFPRPQYLIL
jgi:hypothetical protein